MRLKITYFFITVAMLFCLCLGLERRAYAYVDPGSGLLMLQAAGTILTGILFTVRKHIKALIFRSKPRQVSATDVADPTPEA